MVDCITEHDLIIHSHPLVFFKYIHGHVIMKNKEIGSCFNCYRRE